VIAEAQAVVRQTPQAVKVRVPRQATTTQTLEGLMELGVRYIQLDGAAYAPLLHKASRAALAQPGASADDQLQTLLAQDTALLKALQRKPGVKLAMAFHDVTQVAPQGFAADLDEAATERVFQALTLDRFIFDAGPDAAPGGAGAPRDYGFLRLLPADVQVVLGLIDVSTRTLPDPDDLVREIDTAAEVIDTDRLALAPRHALTVASTLATDEEAEAAWRYQGEVMELLLDASSRAWGIDF
jgi:methionine synthase II (cobalamin-independent)